MLLQQNHHYFSVSHMLNCSIQNGRVPQQDQVFPLSQLKLDVAFDSDPRKQGQEILDLPIKSPDQLKTWQGEFLIISSYAFQEEICEQLSYLADRGVTLVTLYNKET